MDDRQYGYITKLKKKKKNCPPSIKNSGFAKNKNKKKKKNN